jgi:hypothetical protein
MNPDPEQNFFKNFSFSSIRCFAVNRIVKRLSILFAIGTPLLTGYYQYAGSYQFPKWKIFLGGVILGAPFSLGLLLSAFKLGRNYKVCTAILIFISSAIRSTMLLPSSVAFPIFTFEIFVICSLFMKRSAA